MEPTFPTEAHRLAAEAVVDFALASPVHAVLVVNSCARGTATPESDLDVALLIDQQMPAGERQSLEQAWHRRYEDDTTFRKLELASRFARVHLDLFDGNWVPETWDDGGGPDTFEIEIGNRVAHAVALWDPAGTFVDLQSRWLPYYDEALRRQRLQMVRDACSVNIERLHFAVGRNLHFYAFDRLYHAFQEFLQATFIARGVYPIAYTKWIQEQVAGWLGLPALYTELQSILEVQRLEGASLLDNAQHLRRLLDTWAVSMDETDRS